MKPIRVVKGRTVVLPIANVDTDQIIPARFLKVTTREGLGEGLFTDWRYDKDGNPRPDFVLNDKDTSGATVLVAGDNFGCGLLVSTLHGHFGLPASRRREHGIADIFRNNSLKNGLLPVVVDDETHRVLMAEPGMEVVIEPRGAHLDAWRREDGELSH